VAEATADPLRDEERALAEHRRWYAGVVARVREHVEAAVPPGARVAVVSKGDEELVRLGDRAGWHFPQTETGLFAGFHPADGAEAVRHLEHVRGRGAQYLVVPVSARWWLDHYAELRAYLGERCALVVDDPESCLVYALGDDAPAPAAAAPGGDLEAAQVAPAVAAWLDALLPPDAGVVAIGPAARGLDGGRPVRRPATLDDVPAGLDAAARAGIGYAVVIAPPGRGDRAALEAARQAAAARGRVVARQTLAELYELRPAPPAPSAAPRRGLLRKLFRHADGRPDAQT
jgi:hypothetical protein